MFEFLLVSLIYLKISFQFLSTKARKGPINVTAIRSRPQEASSSVWSENVFQIFDLSQVDRINPWHVSGIYWTEFAGRCGIESD